MSIYDEMKSAGVEIDSHESDHLHVPVNDTTREILTRYPEIRAMTFTDNITKTSWYDIPFQLMPSEGPKWPPPGGISTKAYRCGTCLEVFHTVTNHWGDIYWCKNCGSTSRSVCIEPAPEGYARPIVPTIKTRIHYYRFNMRFRKENLRWLALQADLENMHLKCFTALRHKAEILKDNGQEEITLETNFLFSNQWNSTTSKVFDWYLGTDPDTPDIRAGHWLEMTDAMKQLRHDTIVCGYCGYQQKSASRLPFHLGCLDYEALQETELALLRWRRIDDVTDREPLTNQEQWLVPLYRSRQTPSVSIKKGEELQARLA